MNKLIGRLSFFSRALPSGMISKVKEEPIGAYAAFVATIVAVFGLLEYWRSSPTLDLSVRCAPFEEGFGEDEFIYIPMRCLVRNTGSVTSSIDTVSINYLWSWRVAIGESRRVDGRYPYWGTRNIVNSEELSLPYRIDPGVTLSFMAYAPVPFDDTRLEGEDGVFRQPDISEMLEEFNNCMSEMAFRICFRETVGKEIFSHLYGVIYRIAGQEGSIPISGIEITVSDFDFVARHEIDFVESFGGAGRATSGTLLGLEYWYRTYESMRLPWWQRSVGIFGAGEVGAFRAAIGYLALLITFIGLYRVINMIWRRLRSLRE